MNKTDELRVRDHSQPCEHGERFKHGWTVDDSFCPGGKEIILQTFEGSAWWDYMHPDFDVPNYVRKADISSWRMLFAVTELAYLVGDDDEVWAENNV